MNTNGLLYLIDANIVIHANSFYYPLNRVPEFWEWILFHAQNNNVKLPTEIINEVKGGDKDEHAKWVHDKSNKSILQLNEDLNITNLNKVLREGYANDLTDIELEKIGQDPFLISYAMSSPHNRIIVSNETSSPSKIRANRKVPDVCKAMGVRCCNVYTMIRELDFRTNWKNSI
ncbi:MULTISPECIES: DUF4411 family protein [Proteus]|uniref:DUF4411 family protein n=1 Tax=Proteus TaxID=583 RepID=UPI0013777F41|nr:MULTISPECIES: DUF4411 family protein [Proteus]MDK6829324.1 DUF4411 family protein [Proteus mirabilis]MDK7833327.1 DUF4411 family protein [Proteus mirabilis]MDK8634675.1 DUF4411 family protein [Proteus mirabilis]NBN47719.1 DUF4411 family protein [Proteus sp. G2626]WPD00507.1 DUF4411 family protein [Proteus terrae]